MITLTLITLILVVIAGYYAYKTFKLNTIHQMLTQPSASVARSRVIDDCYTSNTLTLDPSLKYLTGTNTLFDFPANPLIVKSIERFEIDDNPIEFISFVDSDYNIIVDEYEQQIYFVKEIVKYDASEDDNFITEDTIQLSDTEGHSYEYREFSPLIDIKWCNNDNQYLCDRLIRLYRREIDKTSMYEYVFIIEDANCIETVHLGFTIEQSQLM